jgi:lipopolysaccharide biosynthesis regulator YciM
MKTKAYKEPKELSDARDVVRSLTFGTDEWEAAMEIVRNLVQIETDSNQALINHRCVFDRD